MDTLAITNSFTQSFLIDSADGHFAAFEHHPCVVQYTTDPKMLEQIIDVVEGELESRRSLAKTNGMEAVLSQKALLMLIIQNEEVHNVLKSNAIYLRKVNA